MAEYVVDHSSPVTSIRDVLVRYLKDKDNINHADIRKAYINVPQDLKLDRPLITIDKGRPSATDLVFQDYISERYDGNKHKFIETRGKELNISYDIHIWNNSTVKYGGETEVERLQERLLHLFSFNKNEIDGITFYDFQEGSAGEDPFEDELFHCRCRLQIRILWTNDVEYEVIDGIYTHGRIEMEV